MDACDVNVTDEDGFLSMIKAKNTLMKERIWINPLASETFFQPLHPDTGALLHSRSPILHLDFYLRDLTGGIRSSWNLPVDVVPEGSQELITGARKLRTQFSMLFRWVSIQVPWRTLATKRCGWRVERGSPVWSARAQFFR